MVVIKQIVDLFADAADSVYIADSKNLSKFSNSAAQNKTTLQVTIR